MTDQAPTTIDRLLDGVPVGHAPISDLLHAGHAVKRRRRRVLIGSTAAATVLVVGGGFLAAQGLPGNSGRTDEVAADTSTGTALSVRVEAGMSQEIAGLLRPPANDAAVVWNADNQTVIYVPDKGYSSSCPPDGIASTAESHVVALDLVDYAGRGVCTADAARITVAIHGLTAPPSELRVTEAGQTSTISVIQISESQRNDSHRLSATERRALYDTLDCPAQEQSVFEYDMSEPDANVTLSDVLGTLETSSSGKATLLSHDEDRAVASVAVEGRVVEVSHLLRWSTTGGWALEGGTECAETSR